VTDQELIADELARAWGGDAWHGPALRELLADVTAAEAIARPIPSAHTIWELVLHLTVWAREVERRARGSAPGEPVEGDWPAAPADADETPWGEARDALDAAHRSLRGTVLGLAPSAIDRTIGAERDQPLGSGVPVRVMLHGVAQHDAYHAGQVALLKKLLRA
jgi:hypothetical protein